MKTLKRFASWLRNNKGVATSLVEATATVAIGPTLASVAVRSDKASSLFIKTIRFSHYLSTESITRQPTLLLDFSFPQTGICG